MCYMILSNYLNDCIICCKELTADGFFCWMFRSNHPHTVFSAMERIMILVVEESEEISLDLLRPLLSSVRKENQVHSYALCLFHFVFVCYVRFYIFCLCIVLEDFAYFLDIGGESYHQLCCEARATSHRCSKVRRHCFG